MAIQFKRIFALVVAALTGGGFLLAPGTMALAHPGHDHGPPAPSIQVETLPRTTTHTDLFEIVAIKSNGQLLIFLDDYIGNTPVNGANLEVTTQGELGPVQEIAPGVYAADWAPQTGKADITVLVSAGDRSDLLLATLDIPAADASSLSPGSWVVNVATSQFLIAFVAGGAATYLLLLMAQRRRRPASPATSGDDAAADDNAVTTIGKPVTEAGKKDWAPRALRTGTDD